MANSANRYFEGLLVGGTLGFVFGLLTAPKPGTELRQDLCEQADDMLSQYGTSVDEIRDRVNERVAPLADKAGEYKERVMNEACSLKEKAQDLKDQASSIKEKANDQICNLKETANEKVADFKEKANEKVADLKDKAKELKDKVTGPNGADLMNNYMGNNSGPVYTAGHKRGEDQETSKTSDAHTTFKAGEA